MLRATRDAHQQTVSADAAPDTRIPVRLARVVAHIVAAPAAIAEHRGELRSLVKALKKAQAELGTTAEGALRDGESVVASEDADTQAAIALLAGRLHAYGVEKLVLSDKATEADVFDLVKLLATPPDQADPVAFFAARAAAVDARAIPRTLRQAAADEPEAPSVKEPASLKERASVKELASAKEPKQDDVAASSDARSDRLAEALPLQIGRAHVLNSSHSSVSRMPSSA